MKKNVPIRSSEKIGRNETCPCGSNKKYKYCCLKRMQDRYKLSLEAKESVENFESQRQESLKSES